MPGHAGVGARSYAAARGRIKAKKERLQQAEIARKVKRQAMCDELFVEADEDCSGSLDGAEVRSMLSAPIEELRSMNSDGEIRSNRSVGFLDSYCQAGY